MKRLTQADLEALVKEAEFRTGWPVDGTLPTASSFTTIAEDFRRYTAELALESKRRYEIWHRACGKIMYLREDPADPINNYIDCPSGSCKTKYFIRDFPRMTDSEADLAAYTVLCEDDDRRWPEKLIDKTDGKRLFGSYRPCTRIEVITSRVKRLSTLRGYKLP